METYGSEVITRQHVTKWVKLFKEGRTDIHDKERSGVACHFRRACAAA